MRTIIKAFFSFTAISLLSLSAFYETSAAREIEIQEAVGSARMYSREEKKARDDTLRDAMKKAVEQGVGTVLASETEVENFQVVSDRILKKSKGTIKSYRILREGAVDNGINYEVVISAVVDDDLLNQSMESFRLMQQMTGRKTVFIVYNPNVQGDLPLNPKNGDHFNLIETAVLAINKKFIERRFSILDFERYKKVMLNRETMALANEADFEDAVSELAAENGAQYYVEFTLMVSDKEIGKNKVAQANIKAKLVNYGTGALIDTIEGKGRKKYKKTTSGMIVFENMGSAIKKAANIAGRELVDSLLTRLYEYAEDGAPIFVSIHVGKKSQVRPFLKMINSMKSVTSSKTVSRIGKDITMYVYGIGDTDSWVGELEDAFYANRKFKGYAVIPALTGETLDLNMEEDE